MFESDVICSIWHFTHKLRPFKIFQLSRELPSTFIFTTLWSALFFLLFQTGKQSTGTLQLAVISNLSRAFKQQRTTLFSRRSIFCFLPLSFFLWLFKSKCQSLFYRAEIAQFPTTPESSRKWCRFECWRSCYLRLRVLARGRTTVSKPATVHMPCIRSNNPRILPFGGRISKLSSSWIKTEDYQQLFESGHFSFTAAVILFDHQS